MASIPGIATAPTNTDTSTPTGSSKLGKDEFVKLLMAQLANQDPASPQSSEAFVAQLAQFAQLELQQTANSNLESILVAEAAAQQTNVSGLVGKDVRFRTDALDLSAETGATPLEINVSAPAKTVVVVIKDEDGKTVDTETFPDVAAGEMPFTWDGVDETGEPYPEGKYTVEVTATGADGKPIETSTSAIGHVAGVSFADGAAKLMIGSLKISLGDVVEIVEPPAEQPADSENETP